MKKYAQKYDFLKYLTKSNEKTLKFHSPVILNGS